MHSADGAVVEVEAAGGVDVTVTVTVADDDR